MPIDGNHTHSQQVYGAQHPPSIKLIRELAVGGSAMSSSSSSATSQTTAGLPASAAHYRDYEKKTNDAWDIDHDDEDGGENGESGGGLNGHVSYGAGVVREPRPVISIAESDEMAKQIIRSHQEKQQKAAAVAAAVASSNTNTTSPKGPGPGTAKRQGSLQSAQTEYSKKLEEQQQSTKPRSSPTSISSDEYKLMSSSSSSKKQDTAGSTLPQQQQQQSTDAQPNRASNVATVTGSTASVIRYGGNSVSSTSTIISMTRSDSGSSKDADEQARLDKFKRLLSVNPVDLNELQKACWKGIPKVYRHICWKLLSDYLPLNQELQEKTIEQKRNAYWEYVAMHYGNTFIDSHHDVLRQILNDIPRMNPLLPIFQNKIIQDIFQRVLYVWAVRHPGTGYVQGINDLLTPFFVVFLNEYTDIDIQNFDIESLAEAQRRSLEADCYWCMNKLLERIQENYVCSQPGIQKNIRHLEYLIKRIDVNLYNHLKKNGIEFIQFAFRWMNNLLMREIPLACTIRLWDTYHAEPFGFSDFHLYVCAAFLLRFSKNLCDEKDFQGLMMTLQNLPTKNMKASDIELLTAEAYQLQVMFANSPNHTSIQ